MHLFEATYNLLSTIKIKPMRHRSLFFSLICVTLVLSVHRHTDAQICIVHSGSTSYRQNINLALSASQPGDTIYLPGGIIPFSGPIKISKALTIVGTGINPDSSAATGISLFTQPIYITTGAGEGSIVGVDISSFNLGDGTPNSKNVNNYRIERCKISSANFSNGTGDATNIYLRENLISGAMAGNVSLWFANNVIIAGGYSAYTSPSTFTNNIFFFPDSWTSAYSWNGMAGSMLTNNIFVTACCAMGLGSNNIFRNNLFCSYGDSSAASFNSGNNTSIGNILNQAGDSIFTNAPLYGFHWNQSYSLKTSSPGHLAGTDSTDVGVFGSSLPMKTGVIPFNPHISLKFVSPQMSNTGNLGIQVKGTGQ